MPASFFDQPPDRMNVVDGATVCRTLGSWPPAMLLHGYPESHGCWHRVAPRLAEHYTLVADAVHEKAS